MWSPQECCDEADSEGLETSTEQPSQVHQQPRYFKQHDRSAAAEHSIQHRVDVPDREAKSTPLSIEHRPVDASHTSWWIADAVVYRILPTRIEPKLRSSAAIDVAACLLSRERADINEPQQALSAQPAQRLPGQPWQPVYWRHGHLNALKQHDGAIQHSVVSGQESNASAK